MVRCRDYAHGVTLLVTATVVLPVMAVTVDEYVWGGDSLKGGRAGGASVVSTVPSDGWWSRTLFSVCDARARVRRLLLCGARLRSGVRVGTGWVETAAERRCARTAPCIGNNIDKYLICQLSIYCYLLHISTGLLLSAHILLLNTSPTTIPQDFPRS